MVAYSTYLPGVATKYAAVDRDGYLYFPALADAPCKLPAQSPQTGDSVYGSISKLQPHGDGIVWTACLPGSVGGLALDATGSIYVANNRNGASVVTKLSPDASKVVYSTAVPAAVSAALAVDRGGNVYITGSATTGLPTTPGAYALSQNCGGAPTCTSGFVVKIRAVGGIEYASYSPSPGNGIAVNSRGDAWITGTGRFYGRMGFVAKFGSTGEQLFSRTFGGGLLAYHESTDGDGLGIAVDAQDAVYVVGDGTLNVPTTPGTIQPYEPLDFAAHPCIFKLDNLGNVMYGTYLDSRAAIYGVAVDAAGNAYIGLNDGGSAAVPGNCGGNYTNATLLILNADASKILASSPVGGHVIAISRDEQGAVYVAGTTGTSAFLVTPGAYRKQYPFGTLGSGFAAKVDFSQPAGPAMTCLVNAASWWTGRNKFGFDGSVAPGEVVTLFGRGFQPGPDSRVTFDGVPAPILYADAVQINAVVPFKAGQSSPFTLVSINNGTQVIGPYELPVSAAVAGIFGTYITGTFISSEFGTAVVAALNEDGSINSNEKPTAPGSIVSVFTTGAGAYTSEIGDGALGPMQPPFPTPVLGVGVLIWPPSSSYPGKPAQVLFAGQAPGLIAGVVQVNFRVPDDTPPGETRIAVTFGDYSSTYPLIYVGSR